MSFPLFLSWIFEKNGLNHQKYGQAIEVLRCGIETHAAAKAHAKAWHATPWHGRIGGWPSLGFAVAKLLFAVRKNVVFYFVLLFCYSKDLSIGLIRIL